MTKWEDNDKLFHEELTTGHQWATYVAGLLQDRQIRCHVNPIQFRDTYEDRQRFQNEQDILLDAMPGAIEVKSRRLTFGSRPESYPFDTALVDTQTGWNRKSPKPLAVVLVSQTTREPLVVPVSTSKMWGRKSTYDKVRQINDTWLTIDRDLLRTFDEFVEWLTSRQQAYTTPH